MVDPEPFQLSGCQCLVFFLGGIPRQAHGGSGVTLVGFSADRTRPTQVPEGSRPGKPFFVTRLVPRTGKALSPP